MMIFVFYVAFCGTFFFAVSLLLSPMIGERSRTNKRVRELTGRAIALDRRASSGKRAAQTFQRVVRDVRARIGLVDDEKLRQRFVSTGLKGGGHVEMYLAARMLGPMLAILIASFIPANAFFWAIGMAATAYLAPDFWLEKKIKGRRERIRRSIPDAVDLLVICVDAGLGLDQAMLRVGQELSISHPEINEEFMQINREQRAGKPRMDAWQSMADRTKVPDVAAFTSMLAQTEKFGTPIARALSVFADGVRQKRRQRAEEMAAKTTVKMIFPLVICIFPSMFIVLLAPAVLSVGRGLSGLSH
jgi:tight adherence protein C